MSDDPRESEATGGAAPSEQSAAAGARPMPRALFVLLWGGQLLVERRLRSSRSGLGAAATDSSATPYRGPFVLEEVMQNVTALMAEDREVSGGEGRTTPRPSGQSAAGVRPMPCAYGSGTVLALIDYAVILEAVKQLQNNDPKITKIVYNSRWRDQSIPLGYLHELLSPVWNHENTHVRRIAIPFGDITFTEGDFEQLIAIANKLKVVPHFELLELPIKYGTMAPYQGTQVNVIKAIEEISGGKLTKARLSEYIEVTGPSRRVSSVSSANSFLTRGGAQI